MNGLDCNTKLSYLTACKFKASGFDFAIRYVGRYTMNTSIDIDKTEKDNILNAGLDLGLVQHCPGKPGIIPSKELGREWGANARKFADQSGYEHGKIVYLDLEDVNSAYRNKQDIILEYCNAWYEEVSKMFTPGIYIGFNNYLTSDLLYYDLRFKDYWESLSRVPDVAVRGYAIRQYPYGTLHGIQIDKNTVEPDRLGRTPCFMKGKEIDTTEFDNALEVIKKAGITNSPDYWKTKSLDVKYLDNLIINMSNYIGRKK